MFKNALIILFSCCVVFSVFTQSVKAESENTESIFKAKITKIINEKTEEGLDGLKRFIQTYKLKGLEGEWKNKEITIENSEFNVLDKDAYKEGDILLIVQNKNINNEDRFAIVDYVRETPIYWLIIFFAGLVIFIGKIKGVKALISLSLSFVIIMSFIVPQIASGHDPVWISTIGGILIILLSLYLTYGFKMFTHLATISIGISLAMTVFLSKWLVWLTRLTGTVDENTSYLTQIMPGNFNGRGLLIAGFIIGALGVLDDIVINQISVVEELHKTNPKLDLKTLFYKGLKVGIDHISAIVNSLFLAYVGASFPLLLLFTADHQTSLSITQTINLEIIAIEIIRILGGSIGLILSVPLATIIASIFFIRQYQKTQS